MLVSNDTCLSPVLEVCICNLHSSIKAVLMYQQVHLQEVGCSAVLLQASEKLCM